MDDRRFDSLVKGLATGTSRRALFKGLLGLGGAAVVGTALQDTEEGAAQRRPTPTPKPPTCPGQQTPVNGQCQCVTPKAPGTEKCGPSCCNPSGIGAAHTECCDQACCAGHCYGEELCCPYPRTWCEATEECCPIDQPYCCGADGCCATPCCDTTEGLACCEGDTPKCCPEDICIPADGCCTDDECNGCESCTNHVCVDDRANCPGGLTGCDECIEAECVANNQRCEDGQTCNDDICNVETGTCSHPFNCHGSNACCTGGNECTNHTCLENGSCDYSPNCNGLSTCCNDGNACTQDICNTNGTCSNPFYCTSDSCCIGNPNGPTCNTGTGACYTPCAGEQQSCADVSCCEGVCLGIPDVTPEICFSCIPSFFEGIPVPCLGFCEYCCSGKSFLGVCVDCGLIFNSCQADAGSCCDGFKCCYNPFDDNFCFPADLPCPLG